MSNRAVEQWARRYRAEAKADNFAILRDHLRRLGLPDAPELLLEGTIGVVRAMSSYCTVDGQDETLEELLELQRYRPLDAAAAPYAFTFDIFGRAFARIFFSIDLKIVDLADLYNHPWYEYECVGYNPLMISRADWRPLTGDEIEQLESAVTSDLRFDYCEAELEFWFDDASYETHIVLHLQDVEKEDE